MLIAGFIISQGAMWWQGQQLQSYMDHAKATGEYSLEDNAYYYRSSMIPALLVCAGGITIGLSAFVRTKTGLLGKIAGALFIFK